MRLSSHDRLPALDGLRGLAILLVLVFHFGSRFDPDNWIGTLFLRTVNVGWAGVDLFFVLSGFLITGILYDARGGPAYFRAFYIRRILRIFPLYYLFIGSYAVLLPWLLPDHPGTDLFTRSQGWWWAYASNVRIATSGFQSAPLYTSPMWSLAVEEQFYLLWPLFVFVIPTNLARWCLYLFAAAFVVRVALVASGWELAAMVLTPARMDCFAIGGWLAIVGRERGLESLTVFARRAVAMSGIALAIMWLMDPRPADTTDSFRATIGFSLIAILFAGGLASALNDASGMWGRMGTHVLSAGSANTRTACISTTVPSAWSSTSSRSIHEALSIKACHGSLRSRYSRPSALVHRWRWRCCRGGSSSRRFFH